MQSESKITMDCTHIARAILHGHNQVHQRELCKVMAFCASRKGAFQTQMCAIELGSIAHASLALQLHSPFEMGAARFGLMGSSPERPCDDVRGLDAPLCKLDDDAADFLDRPADQERRFVRRRSIIFLGDDVILARCRMTAIMAKASMTSET